MQVKEESAKRMLENLGFSTSTWTPSKLAKRLNGLKDFLAKNEVNDLEDTDDANLRDEILEANDSGEEVLLEDSTGSEEGGDAEMATTAATNGKHTKASKGTKASAKGAKGPKVSDKKSEKLTKAAKEGKADKEAKEPKAKKEKAEKDKFGCRKDSEAAAINNALSRKAKSAAEIAEESGASNARVYGHLRWLEKKDFVEKTDKGYISKLLGK